MIPTSAIGPATVTVKVPKFEPAPKSSSTLKFIVDTPENPFTGVKTTFPALSTT